jgi:hypothetical protein
MTISTQFRFRKKLAAIPTLLLLCWIGIALVAAATDLPTVLPANVKIVHFPSASLGMNRRCW